MHTAAATQPNEQCSATDAAGYRYLPDVLIDEDHLSDVDIITFSTSFYIYSLIPDPGCTGSIIGADYCYYYRTELSLPVKRVFRMFQLERVGNTFVPKENTTETIYALPKDLTGCTESVSLSGFYCCERMTFFPFDAIPLKMGEEIIFGILATNNGTLDYPLLQFGASVLDYHVRAYEVDIQLLESNDVYENVYGPGNTNEEVTSLPVFRFVIGM